MFDGAGLATGLDAGASIGPADPAELVVPEIVAAYPAVTASPAGETPAGDDRTAVLVRTLAEPSGRQDLEELLALQAGFNSAKTAALLRGLAAVAGGHG